MAEFRWFGHNCFRIRGKDAVVMTDPVGKSTGYSMAKQTADLVTVSSPQPEHANLAAVKSGFDTIDGPGEYEIRDIFVTGIRTHQDEERGKVRGHNTTYLIEIDGMVVCHLGDLGHALGEEHAEAMTDGTSTPREPPRSPVSSRRRSSFPCSTRRRAATAICWDWSSSAAISASPSPSRKRS